jgi:23S rRNA (adenine2503-C2)-methyltransferase
MNENEKKRLLSCTQAELVSFFAALSIPAFRAKQVQEWLWKKMVVSFEEMATLGKDLQIKLSNLCALMPLELVGKEESTDKETTKYLWKLSDGSFIESVLIRSGDRRTICVSSQVGCPIGCTFCASGKLGFVRDLLVDEIVAQVLLIHKDLLKTNETPSNIVYMGMGEPLRNYEAVVQSIRLLIDPLLYNFSRRRITLSTVGIVEQIYRLASENLGINLALSLHAPTQEIRQKIIPYARRYYLGDLLKAVDHYQKVSGRDITYEYILIHHVNDRLEDAEALVRLLQGRRGSVNLIPYNPVSTARYRKPPTKDIEAFRRHLDEAKIPNTCRYTKGQDIQAACGQLALKKASAHENA